MSKLDLEFVRTTLLDKKDFSSMVAAFIAKAAEEELDEAGGWKIYYKASMEALAYQYIEEVFSRSESPIERKFLNSLLLSFIKSNGLGLVMHPTYEDAGKEIAEFRHTISQFQKFWTWYGANRPATDIDSFLKGEIERGALPLDELPLIQMMIFKYGYVPLLDSYHLTLQPKFPDLIVDGKSIRADMYFWIPNIPSLNVIVECDGFQFHSDKASFIRDRKRDRKLKSNGFDVIRFSGSEIFHDPVNVPFEIVEYLDFCKKSHVTNHSES